MKPTRDEIVDHIRQLLLKDVDVQNYISDEAAKIVSQLYPAPRSSELLKLTNEQSDQMITVEMLVRRDLLSDV